VGRGGLGVVYEAFEGENRVALKLLNHSSADTIASRRLAREYKELSAIEHRNVVRVLDAGVHEEQPFLVMEFVDGSPLRRYLDFHQDDPGYAPRPPPPPDDSVSITHGGSQSLSGVPNPTAWLDGSGEPDSLAPIPRQAAGSARAPPQPLPCEILADLNRPSRIVRLRDVMAQVCDGLAFIHARGLVHRDIKPSNVLVNRSNCAKLVDFGLVKSTLSSGNTTAAGHVVGTYRYMSPEQARGAKVDGRSDLYAVGGVLYEMLCGRPPFLHEQPSDLLRSIVHDSPAPVLAMNPDADETLAALAERLLNKSPASRLASAVDVARRLRAARPPRDVRLQA
jgi:serine/threonine protein kinase